MDPKNDFLKQYMVEFDVPSPLTEDFLDMIPAQREALDTLFSSGKLLSYTVASDRTRVWAVMIAETESELLTYIDDLPMTLYMDYDYYELMFYNTVHLMPAMSLN
jgi:hypothetical protein